MARHIGIVAVSPEGTALCYREIFRQASRLMGETGHPVVTLHNEPFEEYVAAALRDDWRRVGEMLARSAAVLAGAGAEFCIVPDNLMQHGVQWAETGSPIPWLTMTELVADAVSGDKRSTVGLVGTRLVMRGSTYQTCLGLKGVQVLVPEDESDLDRMDAVIFQELVHGTVKAASRQLVLDIVDRLARRGCEGVILGCSEAPLVLTAENSPIPVYDSTALLAEGAVRKVLTG